MAKAQPHRHRPLGPASVRYWFCANARAVFIRLYQRSSYGAGAVGALLQRRRPEGPGRPLSHGATEQVQVKPLNEELIHRRRGQKWKWSCCRLGKLIPCCRTANADGMAAERTKDQSREGCANRRRRQ